MIISILINARLAFRKMRDLYVGCLITGQLKYDIKILMPVFTVLG